MELLLLLLLLLYKLPYFIFSVSFLFVDSFYVLVLTLYLVSELLSLHVNKYELNLIILFSFIGPRWSLVVCLENRAVLSLGCLSLLARV
jgi:hypothetical protein